MTRLNGKAPVSTGGAAAKRGMDAPTAVLIGVTGGLGHALARLLAAEGSGWCSRRGESTTPRR